MSYIGNIPAENYASFLTETFSVSAKTNYTLSHAVSNENDIRLVINNVIQQPGSGKAYTATGTTLTLTSATSSGDIMYAVYLGRALQTVTPPNASVGTAQIIDSSVTSAKLASGVGGASLSGSTNNTVATVTGANALIGEANLTFDGSTLGVAGAASITRSGGTPVIINRTSNVGELIKFRKDGSDVGKIDCTSAGIGIYLGGTASANALDDYEEGTWEATIQCGSGTITLNSSNNLCKYTKIGRSVLLNGSLTVSAISSPSGDLRINGMPFSSGSGEGGERATGAFCLYNPTDGTPPGLIAQIFGGYASIRIESSQAGNRSQSNHVQAGSELRFTINYQIGS